MLLPSSNNLLYLESALNEGRFVAFSKKGEWYPANGLFHYVRYLFSGQKGYWQEITSIFISQLDAFERNGKGSSGAFIRASEALTAKQDNALLNRRVCALKYRVGELDKKGKIDQALYGKFDEHLRKWKADKSFYAPEQKKLIDRDLRVLQEICSYEEFAKLALNDKALRETLFNWSIRDNNQVQIFVEFPSVCARINSVYLSGRVGRFAGKILHVEKNKDVCLRFQVEKEDKTLESRNISILDESQLLTVRGGGKWSIKEIFDEVFAKKNITIGDFEVFGGEGILPWNSHELGYYSSRRAEYVRQAFDEPKWWERLPVFEIIEESELEKRTGLELKGKEAWGVVMAKATRKLPQLDVDKCHGFLGIAIKQNDKRYRIYDFGKFAAKYPTTLFGYASFLCDTVIAKIEYPDTNNFYSDRQTAIKGEILNEEKGEKLMQLVARDLQKARDNNLIFQFGWENCAFWPQKIFNELFGDVVENLYRIPFLKLEISNVFLRGLVSLGCLLPVKWQHKWVHFVLWALGYERGVVVEENGKFVKKALFYTPCVQGTHPEEYLHLFCPSNEHKLIEEGLQGVLLGGHQ